LNVNKEAETDNNQNPHSKIIHTTASNSTNPKISNYNGSQIYRVNIPDGSVYTGTFKSCLKDGFGRIDFPNGTSYEGAFKNDKMYGKGVLTLENDYVYEGEFKYNLRHGQGVLKSLISDYFYNGKWENGLKKGIGKLIFFI
jgi:hypothetical protein